MKRINNQKEIWDKIKDFSSINKKLTEIILMLKRINKLEKILKNDD